MYNELFKINDWIIKKRGGDQIIAQQKFKCTTVIWQLYILANCVNLKSI